LYQRSRGRKSPIKNFIMDGKVVVGVGNIYANEALFISGIRPDRAAGRVSLARYQRLAGDIKQVLTSAIDQGGTTLRDFVGGDGRAGYFAQRLLVYGRGGQPCKRCDATLREVRLGQRSSVYCATCQR
jgi:formamidopyrimidine-DNA glycosylase